MKDIVTGLTASEITVMHQSIDTIHGIVDRFAINKTDKERSATSALGDAKLFFTLRALDYAKAYPDLMNGKRTFANFVRIHQEWLEMQRLLSRLQVLCRKVDDTHLQIGANFNGYARTFYKRVKEAVEDGEPGASEVLQHLAPQFAAQGGSGDDNSVDENTDGKNNIGGNIQVIPGSNPTDGQA